MKPIYRRVIAVERKDGFRITLECGHTLLWQSHGNFVRKQCWQCAGVQGVLLRRRQAHRILVEHFRRLMLSPLGQEDWVRSELKKAKESAAENNQPIEHIDKFCDQFELTPKAEAIVAYTDELCLVSDEQFWRMSLFVLAEEWVTFFGGTAAPVRDENDEEVGLDVNCDSVWLDWKIRRHYRPGPVVPEEEEVVASVELGQTIQE